MILSRRAILRSTALLAPVAMMPLSALGQSGERLLPVQFNISGGKYVRGMTRAAIISYPLIFVLGAKARAGTGGFGLGGARLEVSLDGPTEADLRALADEAYADLAARLAAKGIAPVPAAEVNGNADLAKVARTPGNIQRGSGILDSRATKSWVAVSAAAAPLLKGQGGDRPVLDMMLLGRMAKPAQAFNSLALLPKLVIDFTNLNSNRRVVTTGTARVSGGIEFSIDQLSRTDVVKGDGRGLMLAARLDMKGQVVSDVPMTGEMAQNVAPPAMSMDSIFGKSRIDAFRADMDPWREQVRAAYRGYNQAIVDAIAAA